MRMYIHYLIQDKFEEEVLKYYPNDAEKYYRDLLPIFRQVHVHVYSHNS